MIANGIIGYPIVIKKLLCHKEVYVDKRDIIAVWLRLPSKDKAYILIQLMMMISINLEAKETRRNSNSLLASST